MDKQTYKAPTITDLGTVADLTQVGASNAGADAKGGSVLHSQGV